MHQEQLPAAQQHNSNRIMSHRWPVTNHHKGTGRLCEICGIDCPISTNIQDLPYYNRTGKKRYAIMDANPDTESLLHTYVCTAMLSPEDIAENRRKWMENQKNFAEERNRLSGPTKKIVRNDDVKASLREKGLWYENSDLKKRSENFGQVNLENLPDLAQKAGEVMAKTITMEVEVLQNFIDDLETWTKILKEKIDMQGKKK